MVEELSQAEWIHPKKHGHTDANADSIDKDPNGSWLVAPLVIAKERMVDGSTKLEREVLGFMSADNPIARKEVIVTPKERDMQRCTLDVIVQMILPLV